MAIQFSCPGCRQPIEVDDEWAGRHVACPFCQRVVTAPTESTLESLESSTLAARKLSSATTSIASPTADATTPRYNRMAAVGFGFSLAAIFLLILGQIMLQFLVEHVGPSPKFDEETQKKIMELSSDPETAGRIMLGGACWCLSFACWLTGLIISSIAATRKELPGHRLAVAGIACSALLPVFICMNVLFSG